MTEYMPEFEALRSVVVLWSQLWGRSEVLLAIEDRNEIPEVIARWEANGWTVLSLSEDRFWMTK